MRPGITKPRTTRSRRRGVSMLMVISVVLVAAVLGMAVLSSNTLQAKASAGRASVVQADSLAESGANRALYYLHNIQDPSKCPFNMPVGGTHYEANVNLGAEVAGTFDLKIDRKSVNRYLVQAVGKIGAGPSQLRRTVTAEVDVNYNAYAAAFGADVTFPASMHVIGDVYTDGNLVNNGTIEGTVYAKTISGTGTHSDTGLLTDVVDAVVDVVKSLAGLLSGLLGGSDPINHYTTYSYNQQNYSGKMLNVSSLADTTLSPPPDGSNPAGVFVKSGTLDLNGNVTINGTLVVMGHLRVQGSNNVIKPALGFPALIVDDDVRFKQPSSSLDVGGLMYFGGRVVRASGSVVNSALRVNGAVYNPGHGSTTFDPGFGRINVKYDRVTSSVRGWNLDYPNPQPASVTVVSWKTE